jgi:hypothetical protein
VLATAVAAAAIVAVLLATGAFSGGSGSGSGKRKPQAAAAKTTAAAAPAAPTKQASAAPLLGTWQGTATQTATTREKYPAEVSLAVTGSTVGQAAGTLSEKARGKSCKGVVKLISRDASHVFRYDEKPPQTGCIDRTTVTVTPSAGGDIDFYEIYTADDGNQGTVVGKLKRSGGTP